MKSVNCIFRYTCGTVIFTLLFFYASMCQSLFTGSIEEVALKYLEDPSTNGLVIGLIEQRRSEIKGFGHMSMEDQRKPDGETIFGIGGLTGVFTATLMMLESDVGKFRVEDRISDFLPADIVVPEYYPMICGTKDEMFSIGEDRDYSSQICKPDLHSTPRCMTFCDLASHTSGLSNMPKGTGGKGFLKLFNKRKNPYSDFTKFALYSRLYRSNLTLAPGSFYQFSNMGMALLGNLLSDINQQPYVELLEDRLLLPLQMHSTFMTPSKAQYSNLAIGHNIRGREISLWQFGAMGPAIGLRSSAADLLRFVKANLFLSDERYKNAFIQTQQSKVDLSSDAINGSSRSGYGWKIESIEESPDLSVIWISGSTGGFQSFMGFNQRTKVGLVVLSNSGKDVEGAAFDILINMMSIDMDRSVLLNE